MKDLKHYFSSPKDSDQTVCVSVMDNNQSVNLMSENLGDVVPSNILKAKTKKKKRKRKLSEESDLSIVDEPVVIEPVDKKKRKKSIDSSLIKSQVSESMHMNGENKLPESVNNECLKGEKRSKNSSSSSKKSKESCNKENNISDSEDKLTFTPDSSKNLLNYFSKVDRLPEIPDRKLVIKVEALIHADITGSPPSDCSSNGRKSTSSIKKKKSKRKKEIIDYDLITSEEIPQEPSVIDSPLSSKSENKSRKLREVVKILDDNNGNSTVKEKPPKPNMPKISLSNKEKSTKKVSGTDTVNADVPKEPEPSDPSDEVVFVKYEAPKEKSKVKHDGTLASFFNLGNRPPPVPIDQRVAKQKFLNSGVPSCIKKITVSASCQGNAAPFPIQSHLQQKDKMNILWNLKTVKFDFSSAANTSIDCPSWVSLLDSGSDVCASSREKDASFDSKASLKELKKELNLFPIGCWYKELKKMKKGNEHHMWTERYRPQNSSTFLANTRSISRLKAWLTELKESVNAESGDSSGDEFVKDGDGKTIDRKTLVLLTGPPGTGKTAAVYAVAQEIGYNVLEINASYNRSGKRMLNEFSEAMQSHKVGVSKLNFSKVKKKAEDPKRSLILIEDADLLFEDDEGFVSTLMTLGATTKRPIILVANNPDAKHFLKLSSLFHCSLDFVPPTSDRLSSWLRTVAAVEGFNLTQESSEKLSLSVDLRKSLLQLQLLKSNPTVNISEKEKEQQAWNKFGAIELSSKTELRQNSRAFSALVTLDILNQKQSSRDTSYWHKPLEDSTLNVECMAVPYHGLDDVKASLLGLISSTVTTGNRKEASQQFEIPRHLIDMEKDVCSMTGLLNRRSNALDMWPALRQISRLEEVRLSSHTKRNNRFYNYLFNLGIKGPPDVLQSLSSTFS